MKIHASLLVIQVSLLLCATSAQAQTQLYSNVGAASGDHLGYSVSGAGDLDADGVPDLLYGAPYSSAGAPVGGQAFAYSGRTGALLHAWSSTGVGDNLGWAVAPVGDFNHDGVNDVAVSAFGASPSGQVRVYSGSTGALFDTRMGGTGEAIGRALAGGSDLDGDGWSDLVVGLASTNGTVRVYSRSPSHVSGVLYTLSGMAAGDMFGRSVAVGGDMDHDGFRDIIVGAPGSDINGSGAGMVRAFSGRTGGSIAIWNWLGDDLADGLGESVADAGDVNGDGWSDVIAGAPYFEAAGHYVGLARIYSGRTGVVIRTLLGDPAFQYFGSAVAGVGDLDGDGKAEVAVSSPHSWSSPMTDGMVQIFSGATGAAMSTLYGDTYPDAYEFGFSLANPGDLNGDGKGDLLIGSSEDSVYTGGARSYLLGFPVPSTYCVAKMNSLSCLPAISFSGSPSASIGNNFVISASNVRNRKVGLMVWGWGSTPTPLGGGTLCVSTSIHRTTGFDSGGNPLPTNDCTGTYAFACDHAYMAAKGLVAGVTAYAQFWSRDPGFSPPNNIGLTDALSFTVCP